VQSPLRIAPKLHRSQSLGLDYGNPPSPDSSTGGGDSTEQDPLLICCATADRRDNAGGPSADSEPSFWEKGWEQLVSAGEKIVHAIGDALIGEDEPPNPTHTIDRPGDEYTQATGPGRENAERTWSFFQLVQKLFNTSSNDLVGPSPPPAGQPPQPRPGPNPDAGWRKPDY